MAIFEALKTYPENNIVMPRFNEENGFYTSKQRFDLMSKNFPVALILFSQNKGWWFSLMANSGMDPIGREEIENKIETWFLDSEN